jgi:hypothetical protein
MHAKLLVETTDPSEFEYIIEEKNNKSGGTIYIKGPYAMATNNPREANKNKRMYCPREMAKEVSRYTEQMINTKRALGELNHPTSADVDLERACHLVTELVPSSDNPDIYIGKSKVLSTPSGLIVQSLIRDGCSVGMSTRSLGKLVQSEDNGDVSQVKDMRLVAIDCVADPSFGEAFVNGILESKQYVLNNYGQYVEAYENLELGLSNLPRKDVESYIKDSVLTFLDAIKRKI